MNSERILENWNKLIDLIENTFSGERKEKLLKMYEHFKDRMLFAPASGQQHFHLCEPGGYVEHILNIVRYSKAFYQIWKDNDAYTEDYTEEELIFAAMHHDLGKVGDLENDNYIPNPSEWHRINQGKIYITNPDIQYMAPPDRGIWILSQFDIKFSINEMLGIKLADGMYDDGNISYLKSYNPEKKLKSNMHHIIHQADMTTTRIEYEQWLHRNDDAVMKVDSPKKEKSNVEELKSEFDKLFSS